MELFNRVKNIDSLCKLYSGKKVIVLIPGGNRGDGLIYAGARLVLNKYKVVYTEVRRLTYNIKAPVLFVYGCGGYGGAYGSMPRRIMPFVNNFSKIYIWPSSFDTTEPKIKKFIQELPDHIMIFCRERVSYKNVLDNIKNKDNVRIDHDTALFFDFNPYKQKGIGMVLSFRRDREKKKKWLFNHNAIDASYGNYNTYKKLIDIISKYDIVVTDRAHVMITASLLGKKTHVLPSNYFKLKAIYDYSLKHLKNVRFHNNDAFLKRLYYHNNTLAHK